MEIIIYLLIGILIGILYATFDNADEHEIIVIMAIMLLWPLFIMLIILAVISLGISYTGKNLQKSIKGKNNAE